MHIFTFEQHINENSPCWDGYQQIGMKTKNGKKVPKCVPIKKIEEEIEAPESLEEFSKNRLAGATKIAMSAKEKSADGKLDVQKVKQEYDKLLTDLYEATRNSMDISQIKFQELVGKIEVLGELLIRMTKG